MAVQTRIVVGNDHWSLCDDTDDDNEAVCCVCMKVQQESELKVGRLQAKEVYDKVEMIPEVFGRIRILMDFIGASLGYPENCQGIYTRIECQ